MTDTDRRLRELEDEARYLLRRLDDAIARPPVVTPMPVYPHPHSPSVPALPWQPLGPSAPYIIWSTVSTEPPQ